MRIIQFVMAQSVALQQLPSQLKNNIILSNIIIKFTFSKEHRQIK